MVFKLIKPIAVLVLVILLMVVGGLIHSSCSNPRVVTRVVGDTKVVTVEKPILTEKTIETILTDPKDKAIIKSLLKENEDLKLSVTALTQTLVTLKSSGGTGSGGLITTTPPIVGEAPTYTFTDWQLTATYGEFEFSYDLNQKFEILTSTGRAVDGSQTGFTRLYQIGPGDVRIPTMAKTVAIFADERVPHFIFSPRVQGGVGMTNGEWVGVAAFQWLKRGKSTDPKEIKFALLSPVVIVNKTVKDVGLLPISLNLGSLPHQPFSNLWVSPLVTRTRAGITLTATF